MQYFIVNFIVTIDATKTEYGKIGSMSARASNTIKNLVEKYYRLEYPIAKQIAVTFSPNKEKADYEEYKEAMNKFMKIK